MKKLALVIGLIFLLALAIPAMAGGNGAVIANDNFCPIYTGEYGTILPVGYGIIFTYNSTYVTTGNVLKIICHGQLAENFPAKAVVLKGTSGTFPYVGADAWQVVITPGGEATLTARMSVD